MHVLWLRVGIAAAILGTILVVLVAAALSGGASPTGPAARGSATSCLPASTNAPAAEATAGDLDAEQTRVRDEFARAVDTLTTLTAEERDRALVILYAAALVEGPNLRNPAGGHLDSVGSLQQRDAWGPAAVRMDPYQAAVMFLTGGRGGQPGLLDYDGSSARRPDWRTLDPGMAAQRVQVSAYPLRYGEQIPRARALLATVRAGAPTAGACVPLTAPGTPDAAALIANPNVRVAATPRAELAAGIVDGRLIAALNALSARHTFTVDNFKGDRTVTRGSSSTRMSNHYYGRAVDMMDVGGRPVLDRGEPVRALVRDAVALGVPEIGQPFSDLERLDPGVFANAAHQNHVHLGYWSPTTGTWGP